MARRGVSFTFSGENRSLRQAARQSAQDLRSTGTAATRAGRDIKEAARENVVAAARERVELAKLRNEYLLVARNAVRGSKEQVAAAQLAQQATARLRIEQAAQAKQTALSTRASTGLRNALGGLGYSMKTLGAGTAALELFRFVKAGRDSEASGARVRKMVENLGFSWAEHGKQIDQIITKHSRLSGLDDEELSESFANLLRTTRDINEAFRLNALSADIARTKGMDLAGAAALLARVYNGNLRGLKQLGIEILPVTRAQDELRKRIAETKDEGIKYSAAERERIRQLLAAAKHTDALATRQKAIAELQRQFGGQAEQYGKSAAGATDRFRVSLENVEETIGEQLLPTFTKGLDRLSEWLQRMDDSGEAAAKTQAILHTLHDIIEGLTPPIKMAVDILTTMVDLLGGAENATRLLFAVWAGRRLAVALGGIGTMQKAMAGLAGAKGIGAANAALGTAGGKAGLLGRLNALSLVAAAGITVQILIKSKIDELDGPAGNILKALFYSPLNPAGQAIGIVQVIHRIITADSTTDSPVGGVALSPRISFDPATGRLTTRNPLNPFDPGTVTTVKAAARDMGISVAELTKKLAALKKAYQEAASAAADSFDSLDTLTKGKGLQLQPSVDPSSYPEGSILQGRHETDNLPGFPALDIAATAGTPVGAPEAGLITRISGSHPGTTDPNYNGWAIYMIGDSGYSYYIKHLGTVAVRPGMRVKRGTLIGTVAAGTRGGDHIHIGRTESTIVPANVRYMTTVNPGADYTGPGSFFDKGVGPAGPAIPPTTTTTTPPKPPKLPPGTEPDDEFADQVVKENKVLAGQIDRYLRKKTDGRSPLIGQGKTFVAAGRKYGIDPRYLVALTGAESGFGVNCYRRFNPFGWGGLNFSSWEEAIFTVAKGLREDYVAAGQASVFDIARGNEASTQHYGSPHQYTPPTTEANKQEPFNVSTYLREMQGDPGDVTFDTGTGQTFAPTTKPPAKPLIPLRLRQRQAAAELTGTKEDDLVAMLSIRDYLRAARKKARGERRLEITEALAEINADIADLNKTIADTLRDRVAAAVAKQPRRDTGEYGPAAARRSREFARREEIQYRREAKAEATAGIREARAMLEQLAAPWEEAKPVQSAATLKKKINALLVELRRDLRLRLREAAHEARQRLAELQAELERSVNAEEAAPERQRSARESIAGALAQIREAFAAPRAIIPVEQLTARLNELEEIMRSGSRKAREAAVAEWEKLEPEVSRSIQAAQEAVTRRQDAFHRAFQRISDRLFAAFDRETEKHISSMQEELEGAISDIERAGRELTPAERALRDLQAAHDAAATAAEMAEAQNALATATTPEERAAAQRRIDDLLYQQQVAALQKQADAERQARDEDTQARIAELRKNMEIRVRDYQDQRAAQREALAEQLADWEEHLAKREVTWSDFMAWLQVNAAALGVDPNWIASWDEVGANAGSAFADAFIDELHRAWEALQQLAAGQEPTGGVSTSAEARRRAAFASAKAKRLERDDDLAGFSDGGIVGATFRRPAAADTELVRVKPGEVILDHAQQRNVASGLLSRGGGITVIVKDATFLSGDDYEARQFARRLQGQLRRIPEIRAADTSP